MSFICHHSPYLGSQMFTHLLSDSHAVWLNIASQPQSVWHITILIFNHFLSTKLFLCSTKMKVRYRGSNREPSTSLLSITSDHNVTLGLLSPVGRYDRWAAACWRAPVWAERSTPRSAPTAANQTQRWARWVAAARRDALASARGWWPSLATVAAAALHRSAAQVSCDGIPTMFSGDCIKLVVCDVNVANCLPKTWWDSYIIMCVLYIYIIYCNWK